jgi:hypothetical protein
MKVRSTAFAAAALMLVLLLPAAASATCQPGTPPKCCTPDGCTGGGPDLPTVPLTGSVTYTVPLSAATQDATGIAGDPGGTGTATITVNSSGNQVCSTVSWSGIDSPVGFAHIHAGAYGQPEDPAYTIPLFGPSTGATSPQSGCTVAPAEQTAALRKCPSNFNVVVHSLNHPVGAIRGQFPGGCNLLG